MQPRDPLAECLAFIISHHGRYTTAASVVADLPLKDNVLTPDLFIRAAESFDYKAKFLQQSIKGLSDVFLPCVLILNNDQACVLTKIEDGFVEIAHPADHMEQKKLPLEALEREYAGYLILTAPVYKADPRVDSLKQKDMKRWFWEVLWGFRRDYLPLFFSALLINLFVLVMPLFAFNVYNKVLPNSAFASLAALAIGVVIVVIFDFIIKWARAFLIENNGKKIDIILGNKLFRQMMNMQLAYRPPSPAAFAMHLRDFENLRNFFTSTTIASMIDLPFVVLFVIVIAFFGSLLTAMVPVVLGVIVVVAALFLHKRQASIMTKAMQSGLLKHACAVEAVAAMEDIKSLNAESEWQAKWEKHAVASANFNERLAIYNNVHQNIISAAVMLNMVLVVSVGVYLFSLQEITIGGVIASTMLSARVLSPLSKVAGLLMSYTQAKISLESLSEFFSVPVDRSADQALLSRPNLKGAYQLLHASYAYPGLESASLYDINLQVKPGEKIAILGRVGAGKTTLLKLMMGFYQANEGMVTLDGTDLRQIDSHDIRQALAYVPQSPVLIHGSLKENILLGKRSVPDEQLVHAAKLAQLDSMIQQDKVGFDRVIQERGENISVGQRQLIALARVFVGNPSVILLDEPVSSVDMGTERQALVSLKEFAKQKTLIMVTHRRSMLALVDRIIIVDDGRIKADGPKEKVLKALGMQEQGGAQ